MSLRSEILAVLSREPTKYFRTDDICGLVSGKKATIAAELSKLAKSKKIVRKIHGVYRFSTELDNQPIVVSQKFTRSKETDLIDELAVLTQNYVKSPGRIPPGGIWAQVFTPEEAADLRTKEESDQGPGEVVIEKMLGIRSRLGTRDPKTRSGGCDIASTAKQTFIQQKHIVDASGALQSCRAGIESTNAYFSAIHSICDYLDETQSSDLEKSYIRHKLVANLREEDIATLPLFAQNIIRENLSAEKVLCVGKVQHITLTTLKSVLAFPASLANEILHFYSVSSARVNFRVNIEFVKHMIKTLKKLAGLTIDIRIPAFSQGISSVSREYSKDLFARLAEQAPEWPQLVCPRVEMSENQVW